MRHAPFAVLSWLVLQLALGARPVEASQAGAAAEPSSIEAIDALIEANRLDEAEAAIARRMQADDAPSETDKLVLAMQRSEIARLRWDWTRAQSELDRILERLDAFAEQGTAPEELCSFRSWVHGARAQLFIEVGCLRDASRELAQESRFAGESDDPLLLRNQALHEAAFQLALGEFELALKAFDALPAAFRDDPLAQLYRGSALLELEREDPGRPRRAEAVLREVLDAAPAAGVQSLARLKLAEVRRSVEGDPEGALALLDALEVPAAENAAARDVPGAIAERAFFTAARARCLDPSALEPERAAEVRSELDSAFEVFLTRWGAVPRPPGGIGFLEFRQRAGLVEERIRWATHGLEPEEGAARAYAIVASVHEQGSVSRREELRAPALDELRERLLRSERHGALILVPGQDELLWIAVDRAGASLHATPAAPRLDRAQRRLRDRLHATLARRDRASSAECADLLREVRELGAATLPASLAPQLERWDAVSVVGADLLGPVPIELLGLRDGRLFGEGYAVDLVPSLPVWRETASRTRPAETDHDLDLFACLAPGDPPPGSPGPGGADHDLADSELARITRRYAPDRVRISRGEGATRAAVECSMSNPARVTHFLVHGLFDSRVQQGSGLALPGGPDGLLDRFDAEALASIVAASPGRSAGEVVVLQTCWSMRGPRTYGDDDATHLGAAFLRAGARCVVQSELDLWLGPSLAWVERFHARLRAGVSPAEALRSAREAVRAQGDARSRLEVGCLRLYGVGQEPVFPR